MTIEYKINEQDFIDFQLFTASKSDRINRKKKTERILLTIGSFIIALCFYLTHNTPMMIYFGLVAVVCGLFYPKYFVWRYKKYYKSHIKEYYSKRFGQTERIEINNDSVFLKDKIGEGKINLSEIDKIDETNDHFFLKVSTGVSLIIPKREIPNPYVVRDKFADIGLRVNDETNWKWK
ncbi:MAG: YcxB family protein [Paludibacteraceae bacterium]